MNISFRFLSYPLTPVLIGLSLFNIAPLSYAQSTPQSYSLSEHQAYAESNEKRDTLIDIYDLAKINDHQLKSDHAEYLAGQEAAAISRSALRPQITGTASLSKTDTNTSGNTSSSDTETDNTSYQISLVQQLLNANAWNTYEQGKVQTQLAEAQYKVSEQSLMIRSAQAYFDTLRAMDQLQTDIAEEKAQSTLLEQTRQRYEVGLISINDVHETQAVYDNAVASRINSEASVGIRLDALTVITGKLHNDIAPLKDTFVVVEPEPKNKQAWVDFALANNLELNVSALAAEVSLLGEKAAKSNHLPTLNGSISYTDSDSDSDSDADSLGTVTNTDTNSAAFSLNFSMPLYTGGNLSALQRQAAQSAIQAREDWLFTQRSTIQSTRSLYLSVTTGIAQLKARKQAIISNESALSATKAGYDAGTRDIVDVVNAQSNLFQAQRNHLDTLYDYIVNTLLLKQAAGILQLSDIQSLNASLEIK